MEGLERLRAIVAELRQKCPWDQAQTFDSLQPHTIEEAYELVEALRRQEPVAMIEELGDVLLHVYFYAQIAQEAGLFSLDTVVDRLIHKLIARHPHVYGDRTAQDAKAVIAQWEALKQQERGGSVLGHLPECLPPLYMAYRLQEKAAAIGFDWTSLKGLLAKLQEELAELEAALDDPQKAAAEYGDVLFVLVNLGRHLGLDPELALARTNKKFQQRFRYMEQRAMQAQKSLKECTLQELESYWQASKSLYP